MSDPKEPVNQPSDNAEHISVVAREFPMLKIGDIVRIKDFFKKGGPTDRLSVAIYMIAYDVAASVGFSLSLLPIDRGVTDRPKGGHDDWHWKIDNLEDHRRACLMRVTIIAGQHDSDMRLAIEEIPIHDEPSEMFYARKWNVRFGAYDGVLDLDDPNALSRFSMIAAEEIALSIK